MALSDSELLVAAQSNGSGREQARQELLPRFGRLLTYLAARACQLNGLHASEVDEVVHHALAALLNPKLARFDPGRGNGDQVDAYLSGLIQNAARMHARSIRRGDGHRHDYASPLNAKRGLPSSVEDIPDPWHGGAIVATRDVVSAILGMAGADERELIDRIFFAGEEPSDVAADLGVDRSTVSRRLSRFYGRVRALRHQWVHVSFCFFLLSLCGFWGDG